MHYVQKKYAELKPVINEFIRSLRSIGDASVEDKLELLLTTRELNISGKNIDDALADIARLGVDEMNLITGLIRHIVLVKYKTLETEREEFIKYWLYDGFYKTQGIVTVSVVFQMLLEDYQLLVPAWKLKLLKQVEELAKRIRSTVERSWFPFYLEQFGKTELAGKIVNEVLAERDKNGSWNGNFEKTLKVAYALACANVTPKKELKSATIFINRRIDLGTGLNSRNASLIIKLFYKLHVIEEDLLQYIRDAVEPPTSGGKMASNATKKKVFISYSHCDTPWLERILVHLKPLERQGQIELWSDKRVVAGSKWEAEIKEALAEAAVAVLLITADFFASDFIATQELPVLLNSAKRNGISIVPVIVSHSLFMHHPILNQFQTINPPERPIEDLQKGEQEKVFADLAIAITRHVH